MQGMYLGALVWSVSLALVSGRVGGALQVRVLQASNEGRLAPVPSSDGEVISGSNAVLWANVSLVGVGIALTIAIAVLLLMIRRVQKQRAVLLPQDSWPKTGSRPTSFV